MFLFAPVQVIQKGRIHVPFEMRASLGWHDHTKVYVTRSLGSVDRGLQVVISPIPPNARGDLWHLALRMTERTGLLAELSALLEAKRIDIVNCKAHSRIYASSVAINMDIDVRDYHSTFDGSSIDRQADSSRSLDELEAHIVAQFIEDVEFRPEGKPYISLTRHHQLWRTTRDADERYDTTIRSGAIGVPDQLRRKLDADCREIWKHVSGHEKMLALVVAEPIVSLMNAFIFLENTGHIHFRLNSESRIGTTARITSRLREEGFSILQMYTRNILAGQRCISDVFARLTDDTKHNDIDLRHFLRGVFHKDLFNDINLELSFPAQYQSYSNGKQRRRSAGKRGGI